MANDHMKLYHKIQSIFKRDPDNKYKTFLDGQWSVPAFGILAGLLWEFTEKIDGTNIRIGWDDIAKQVIFGGRTDRAELPGQLRIYMEDYFTPELMTSSLQGPVTLIGEGYGGKIQKGSRYRPDQAFILFDIFVEPTEEHPCGIYLSRSQVMDIACELGIPCVPVIHTGPLLDGEELVKGGMNSVVAQDTNLIAEGVVARPIFELLDGLNRRIITKIKVKDFE